MTEIERKFVATGQPPGLDVPSGQPIRQAYVAVDGPTEVRIRDRAGTCTLTVKTGSGLERSEVEINLDRGQFDDLWTVTAGRRLEKTRHLVELPADDLTSGVVAEIDVYDGPLAGLVVVEAEFPDRASAEAFVPPHWFGTEVTGDPVWSNASLARHGLPDPPH